MRYAILFLFISLSGCAEVGALFDSDEVKGLTSYVQAEAAVIANAAASTELGQKTAAIVNSKEATNLTARIRGGASQVADSVSAALSSKPAKAGSAVTPAEREVALTEGAGDQQMRDAMSAFAEADATARRHSREVLLALELREQASRAMEYAREKQALARERRANQWATARKGPAPEWVLASAHALEWPVRWAERKLGY